MELIGDKNWQEAKFVMDGGEGLQVSSLLHDVGTACGPHGRGWLGACVTRCFGYIRKDIRGGGPQT